MAQKKPRLILPVGVAVFPHLNEVDVYQPVDKKGRPSGAEKRQYITYVRLSADDLKKVEKQFREAASKLGADDDCKLPFKELKAGKDKKETETVIKATSGEKFRPAAFDAKNNRLSAGVIIGGGSKIRLDVSVNYYAGFGGGINLYINAVQVLDLVEGGVSKSNFEEAEGFSYDGDDAAAPAGDDHNKGDGPDAFAL